MGPVVDSMAPCPIPPVKVHGADRKSTRLNSSHLVISYAVFCLKKKKSIRLRSRQILPRRSPNQPNLRLLTPSSVLSKQTTFVCSLSPIGLTPLFPPSTHDGHYP